MDPRDERGGSGKEERGKDAPRTGRPAGAPGKEAPPPSPNGHRSPHRRRGERTVEQADGPRADPMTPTGDEHTTTRPSEKRPRRTGPRVGSGVPPDPWSKTHPPAKKPSDQRGDNGGLFGRGPLRYLYEHKPGDPTLLPPEAGRTAEQSYHGRSGYRAGEVSPRRRTERARSPWLLPVVVVAVILAGYLLSLAL